MFLLWTSARVFTPFTGNHRRSSTAGSFFSSGATHLPTLPMIFFFPCVDSFADIKIIVTSVGLASQNKGSVAKRGSAYLRWHNQSLIRIPLPSVILSNSQSFRTKADELQAHLRFQHEFRDACLLAITDTWLTGRDLETLPGWVRRASSHRS